MRTVGVWRPRDAGVPGALVAFGGYGVMVVAILALAGTGSPIAVVFIALLLASGIGMLTWWCGLPLPSTGDQSSPDPAETGADAASDDGQANARESAS